MNNKYVRSVVYVALMSVSWWLGTLYGKKQEVHLCANLNQSKVEVLFDSSVTLHLEDGQVLAIFANNELPEVLKDPRLSFHACKK